MWLKEYFTKKRSNQMIHSVCLSLPLKVCKCRTLPVVLLVKQDGKCGCLLGLLDVMFVLGGVFDYHKLLVLNPTGFWCVLMF